MFKVTCDGKIIHSDALNGIKVKGGKITLEIGKSGLFEFTIYTNNPYYDKVVPMRSIVEVFKDNESIFRGRVLNIQYGFYNEKQVSCEGELAFLLDSIVPAHTYNGSFGSYLDYIIGIHNGQTEAEKQFKRGSVTVADFTPFNVTEKDFISSFETLNKKMVEQSGGFLQARHENGTMYLDLLNADVDASNVSTQKIRLGKNLIDIKREVEGSEVFSGLVPLGAEVNGKRVDISSVNGGSYSITNSTAVSIYGKIFKTVIFDNITSASALLSEARNYLAENYAAINTVEITAVDLSETGFDLDSFKVGQWVTIESAKHFNQSQTLLIRKMTINLDNPADTKIEVGRTKQGLTDNLGNVTHDIDGVMASINNVAGSVGSAVTKAENAETKATSAETKATNASTVANTANTKANNAVTTANSAVTAVNSVSSRVSAIETEPHITSSGVNSIWTWKKYSDNTCEFYGKIPVTNYTVTTTLGSWFSGANLYGLYDVVYPFALKETPSVTMTFQSTNNTSAVPWVFSANTTTALSYLPQCYLIRPTSVTGMNGLLNIIVKGKF
jgi:methyl-accepting chemotaxis protein